MRLGEAAIGAHEDVRRVIGEDQGNVEDGKFRRDAPEHKGGRPGRKSTRVRGSVFRNGEMIGRQAR